MHFLDCSTVFPKKAFYETPHVRCPIYPPVHSSNVCLGDHMAGSPSEEGSEPLPPAAQQDTGSPMPAALVWGSPCVSRPTMQIQFKDVFLMEIAWYFSSRSKFFDVGVSGRWEISSNSHGTFLVFKKRRRSFYQHFDYHFIPNHNTSFYFNTSQLLKF